MSITLITGLPGGGKSYTAMADFVIPHLRRGGLVVTNITGINQTALAELGAIDGRLIELGTDRILSPSVWPGVDEHAELTGLSADGVHPPPISSGALVVCDECALLFPARTVLPEHIRRFLAAHRHFISEETGKDSQIIFLAQNTDQVPRELQGLVVTHLIARKRTFQSKHLSHSCLLSAYEGTVKEGRKMVPLWQAKRTYLPKICAAYQSYQEGAEVSAESLGHAAGGFLDSRGRQFKMFSVGFAFVSAIAFVLYFALSRGPEIIGGLTSGTALLVSTPDVPQAEAAESELIPAHEYQFVPPAEEERRICAIVALAGGEVRSIECVAGDG